jgi:hypothetical protein
MPPAGINPAILAIVMGMAFGGLLVFSRVTRGGCLTEQLRFKDSTVLKVMLTAILVGGIGVWVLVHTGHAKYAVKEANLAGVALGAVIFGAGISLYGYCPGTGIAAAATGSISAWVGLFGMMGGAIMYALTFDAVKKHILTIAALGKVRLPEITGIPDLVFFALLGVGAVALFRWIEKTERQTAGSKS